MADTVEPALLLHNEKLLLQPAHERFVACCPTMDLIAVVNQEERLDVYRFNGQRAFGLQRRNADATVQSLSWKFNGEKNLRQHLFSRLTAWAQGNF